MAKPGKRLMRYISEDKAARDSISEVVADPAASIAILIAGIAVALFLNSQGMSWPAVGALYGVLFVFILAVDFTRIFSVLFALLCVAIGAICAFGVFIATFYPSFWESL